MASGRHIGKVVLSVVRPDALPLPAVPRLLPQGTYVITGEEGRRVDGRGDIRKNK